MRVLRFWAVARHSVLLELVGRGSKGEAVSERAMEMICSSAAVAAAGGAVLDNTMRCSAARGARNTVGDSSNKSRGWAEA